MRKRLFFLILISAVIISCKKEHKPVTPASATQRVTFTLGFSQSTGAITNNTLKTNAANVNSVPDTSLTNHVNIIFYSVFDSTGNLLHNVYQAVGDTAFGQYADNLHPGKYTVAISAGTNIQVVTDKLSDSFIVGGSPVNTTPGAGGFTGDVFFKRLSITVGSSALSESVVLNRLTSMLIVNINDAIPSNSNYETISISNVADRYYVGTDQVASSSGPGSNYYNYTYTIPSSAWGTNNYRVSATFMYLADFSTGIEVGQTTTTGNTVYGSKTVPNVTAAPNKITLLSGSLFGGSTTNSNGGFQISTDTTWNTPIIKTFP